MSFSKEEKEEEGEDLHSAMFGFALDGAQSKTNTKPIVSANTRIRNHLEHPLGCHLVVPELQVMMRQH